MTPDKLIEDIKDHGNWHVIQNDHWFFDVLPKLYNKHRKLFVVRSPYKQTLTREQVIRIFYHGFGSVAEYGLRYFRFHFSKERLRRRETMNQDDLIIEDLAELDFMIQELNEKMYLRHNLAFSGRRFWRRRQDEKE